MSANNDKRMRKVDSIEIYTCGMSKGLVCRKEKNNCSKIIKLYKTIHSA